MLDLLCGQLQLSVHNSTTKPPRLDDCSNYTFKVMVAWIDKMIIKMYIQHKGVTFKENEALSNNAVRWCPTRGGVTDGLDIYDDLMTIFVVILM